MNFLSPKKPLCEYFNKKIWLATNFVDLIIRFRHPFKKCCQKFRPHFSEVHAWDSFSSLNPKELMIKQKRNPQLRGHGT